MENKLKRFMSLTLALLMVFSMMPQISLGAKAASATKTVYFQNNWLWTDVRCYYWNDGISSSWPGDAMTFVENDGTYDIYKAEIPANAYIIFNGIKNDNSGSRDQTPDMTSWNACAVYYMYWNNGNTVKTDSKKHSYTSVVTAPDCVNAGYTTYTCSSCGDSYTEAGEAATGHSFANCDETCDNCDEPNPDYVAPVTPAAPTLTEAQLNDTILITWKHTAADGAASTNGTYFTRDEIVKSEDGVYTCTLTMTQETLNSQAQGYVTTFDEVHSTHAHALPTNFPTEGGLSFTLTWDAANSEWTYEGVTYTLTCTEKAPGSGTLGTSYISESDDRATIYGEVTGMTNAKESIVVKLYSGETLLATTTLANLDYLSSETLGVNIVISGRASSSWNTVWEEGHPVASHCPDKAVLYIDGVEQNTANVTLGTIDDLGEPYVWAEIEGVSPVIYKVTTYEELVAALENDNAHVLMLNDITGTATQSSGYGKAGIVLNAGDVLDGNGYTLTINGANSTWDCAIAMKGGEVKNLTIAGAMRGVFMPGANGDVVIDNCVFKDVIYTFNSDAGSKDYSVTIKNTTLNGWTSFSDVHGSVTFDTCSFGEGSGYAFCRPYQATTFTNCSFAEGFKLDTTQTADNTLAFNSCTYAGEAISANNSAMFYNGGSVMINGVATDVTNYPAYIGETGYETVAAALAAAVDDDEVVINEAGTYSVPTGKDITITGAVEGVKFDMSKAVGINSSMTFNNVTFEYGNANYVGLQHAGTMVYNKCTINGQVFLYGTSETFNDCIFNQESSDAYNVWTYGAKNVAFNECTFNSAGKSVLIYSEQSDLVNNVTVTKCEFKASTTVSGKAAIEMDSSLTSGINLTIDGETTATGFDKGSVSGDSLWNNKKDNKTEANNDITVTVDNVVVLRPITGSITPGYTTQTAIWGEGGGNAEESLVVELYVGETKIATSSLNNIDGIIDGDVYVTWSIPFAGSADEYWTVQWEEGYPKKDEKPTTVKMIVDGKTVAENEVQMNGPDNLNPVVWEELDYFKPDVAKIGTTYYKTVAEAVAAAESGAVIEIIADGDYTLPEFAGKELTFKAAEGVTASINDYVNKGSQGMAGSTVHFENLTINGVTENYYGLFHTVEVTYKNCKINGLRFLYAPTVSLDGCEFNSNGAEHSFWTYGASNVTVTNCNFTYTDRAVNCYSENGAAHETDISFSGCTFTYAGTSETHEGAVEINSSSVKSIDVSMTDCTGANGETTWFISRWDSAKGENTVVVVDDVKVWPVVKVAAIGDVTYATLAEAISAAAAGDTITLLADITEDVEVSRNLTIDGQNYNFTGNILTTSTKITLTVQNVNFVGGTGYAIKSNGANKIIVKDCTVKDYSYGFLYANKSTNIIEVTNVTVENCSYGLHFARGNKATLENVTMTNVTTGIYSQNYSAKTYTIKNSTISSIKLWQRSETIVDTFNFEGTNTVGTPADSELLKYVLTDGTLTAPEGLTVTSGVEGKIVAYKNGVYSLTTPVAQIGEVGYETFEAALNAVADGETITLLNVEGSEIDKEIDFTKAISFTITGTAPNYELPVVTFQNATVTIKDAEILIPELDARQNATINVVDSKVLDAGGNSIVKSYYNGAINISGTSVVHTMQVTTMGYITVSGTAVLNAAWQTNVYGNGLITVAEGATFNTAALQLTAQEYSGRDNTDADRVGKPAQITVAGTLNVGSVQSSNGADYSYNSSYGINIGTIEGKAALLDIKSGATVNIYMANGETANIGADGTVNVAGTVTVSCRSENGTATVTNNGSIVLTDAAATVTANECGKVTTTVTGYDVTYADGAYSLTAKTPDFETAGILESSGKVRITADIYDLYNVDTFEAKLYDQNGELLTTVTPAVELNYAETTLSIMILGDSSSWDQTDWTPTSAQRPDYIEIWVNGELAATVDVRDNVVGMGELTQEKWDALLGKYYPVAKIGDTGYATLQAAIDAAVNGDTITLVADCAEDVTVVQAENVKITIDGNSKTMSGTITVNGQSHAYDTAGLTIKNVKFDATNISKDASINLGGSNNTRYTNHVTVEDCSFTGTDNAKVGIKNYTGGCKNLTVTDCTATGLHSLIQVKGVDGITVTNVTVENCKNGISVGPSTNVVIENANITAEGYGIRADGTAAYNVTVKNSTISADLPIVVRNNTAEGYNLTLEGTNSLAASNENGYQVIFTSGDDGTYEVPAVEFNLTGAEGLKVFPAYVAQIGDVKYGTVTEAVEAAKPGDTIELIADAEEASVILLDGIDLDLYGHTLTVTGYIAAYDGNNIIDTDGNGLLKITKGKIMIQDDNTYLPIWDDTNKGYVFANCENFKEQTNVGDNSVTYIFLPELEGADYELIAKGIEVSGVTMKVEASWTRSDGTLGTATFTYTDALMQQFYSKYDAETDKFGSAFTLILTGTEGKTLSYKVYFVSDTGVTYECN